MTFGEFDSTAPLWVERTEMRTKTFSDIDLDRDGLGQKEKKIIFLLLSENLN